MYLFISVAVSLSKALPPPSDAVALSYLYYVIGVAIAYVFFMVTGGLLLNLSQLPQWVRPHRAEGLCTYY